MMEQGFRGNYDSQGKLGMCSSLAELYASGFSKTSRRQPKVFWSNNFSKMLARFRASSPDRCPQAAKSPCHAFGTRRGWWEKRKLFEAANKTAPPCETLAIICYLATVPGEQLQRNISTKYILRNTDFQRPAKGGSTPAFACQHAAIAPLPCPNL